MIYAELYAVTIYLQLRIEVEIKNSTITKLLVGPEGPTKGGYVNGLQNSYDVGCQGSAGLWIVDVTKTGELIYAYED